MFCIKKKTNHNGKGQPTQAPIVEQKSPDVLPLTSSKASTPKIVQPPRISSFEVKSVEDVKMVKTGYLERVVQKGNESTTGMTRGQQRMFMLRSDMVLVMYEETSPHLPLEN